MYNHFKVLAKHSFIFQGILFLCFNKIYFFNNNRIISIWSMQAESSINYGRRHGESNFIVQSTYRNFAT